MDGLFDNLRSPEYSSAIGLILYSASAYTQYEIDINKRVRHTNETPIKYTNVNLSDEFDIPTPPTQEEKEKMVILPSKKDKKSDKAGSFSKFWNWATQLF